MTAGNGIHPLSMEIFFLNFNDWRRKPGCVCVCVCVCVYVYVCGVLTKVEARDHGDFTLGPW